VQYALHPSQTFTIKKTHYQRAAHTQFHEPINTDFALITIFSSLEKSDKSYQEDVHYCQALSDGNEFLASHKLKIPK
jgi:S-adenosylmethionine:tRNA-ribosyltransferase-isomerase (queuine synthetase)